MNDRYLFKAKRKNWRELPKEEQWVQGYLFDNGFSGNTRYFVGGLIIQECKSGACDGWYVAGINFYEIDPSTLCQCTGLKGKEGNLIWENDVVKQFADCDKIGNYLYFFYQIKYDEKYARFYGHEIYTKENVLFDELNDIEVIGNIFDNPELLEVE